MKLILPNQYVNSQPPAMRQILDEQIGIGKLVPGGVLNSRPTPKAFGAALFRQCLAQMVYGQARILLRFQFALDSPCILKVFKRPAGD